MCIFKSGDCTMWYLLQPLTYHKPIWKPHLRGKPTSTLSYNIIPFRDNFPALSVVAICVLWVGNNIYVIPLLTINYIVPKHICFWITVTRVKNWILFSCSLFQAGVIKSSNCSLYFQKCNLQFINYTGNLNINKIRRRG